MAHGRPSLRGPGAICSPQFGGKEPTVAPARPSSRGLGVLRAPDSCGKEPTPAASRPSSRRLGVLRTPGPGGKERTAATTRRSSRGLGMFRTPGPGGKKPMVSVTRPSSRGLGVLRTPGSGGKEPTGTMVSTMGPSSWELGATCVSGFRGKRAAPALGGQRSVYGSDVLPVSAIGGVESSSVPPFARQWVRNVSGGRPLGLVVGTDP